MQEHGCLSGDNRQTYVNSYLEYATSPGRLGLLVNNSRGLPDWLSAAVHIIDKGCLQPFCPQHWTLQASIDF